MNSLEKLNDGFDKWMAGQEQLVSATLQLFPENTHALIKKMMETAYSAGANNALEMINELLPDHRNETDSASPSTPENQQ